MQMRLKMNAMILSSSNALALWGCVSVWMFKLYSRISDQATIAKAQSWMHPNVYLHVKEYKQLIDSFVLYALQ